MIGSAILYLFFTETIFNRIKLFENKEVDYMRQKYDDFVEIFGFKVSMMIILISVLAYEFKTTDEEKSSYKPIIIAIIISESIAILDYMCVKCSNFLGKMRTK
jgi:hypothetical protein